MSKLCECGCGQPTPIAARSRTSDGEVKGEAIPFIHGHRPRRYVGTPPKQPLQGLSAEERFWHHVTKTDNCWNWGAFRNEKGYGIFRIYRGPKDKSGKTFYAHRYSWAMHNGPIPKGLCVCHHCDNPSCVRPDHLFLGTIQDNTRDMIAKGRYVNAVGDYMRGNHEVHRGERNPQAVFTEDLVREIRKRYAAGGTSQRKLAREYGVSAGAIQSVVERKNWTHVKD